MAVCTQSTQQTEVSGNLSPGPTREVSDSLYPGTTRKVNDSLYPGTTRKVSDSLYPGPTREVSDSLYPGTTRVISGSMHPVNSVYESDNIGAGSYFRYACVCVLTDLTPPAEDDNGATGVLCSVGPPGCLIKVSVCHP